MLPLRSVQRKHPQGISNNGYPFTLPVVQAWEPLEFSSPVTFFVGENGSGKSTILEAIALAASAITVGSQEIWVDGTLDSVRSLSASFKLIWSKRTRRGFFLRAEDFFGYVKAQAQTRQEMEREIKQVDEEYKGRSRLAQDLAKMPYANQLHAMKDKYGQDLNMYSHGESFLTLFQARFVPGGLYLLDEPEAPLSPIRQLSLLSMMKEMVAEGAQFIIATHSPILMAYPEATILSFDQAPLQQVAYNDLEHVNLTRDFLNNPENYLRRL